MRFADPAFLALLVVPMALAVRAWRRKPASGGHLALPSLAFLADWPTDPRARWRSVLPVLRLLGAVLLILALARPQIPKDQREIRLRSRNVVLALDISSSMKAGDFQPGNRLAVARRVMNDFVQRREGDLIGLVLFAGRAFLQAPLTPDLALLRRIIEKVEIGMLPDGTAIGTALAMSLNQLKDLPPKASTIVLVTDGANNTGRPTPLVAAEAARALGVRIQTVGLSTLDTSSVALNSVWRVGSTTPRLTTRDEATLQRMAERTGGRYYRATDPATLEQIMLTIDEVERTEARVGEIREYRELYPLFLLPALLLLILELGLGATWLRSAP
jgi:Ca-activated chloride channel family protein